MKSRTIITIVILVGVGVTAYLSIFMPTMVPIVVPAIVSAATVAIPLLAKMGETEAKVDNAIVASKSNAIAIESVSAQVIENTAVTEQAKNAIGEVKQQAAQTHDLVNGQSHELAAAREEVAEMRALVARLTGAAEGREAGRQIAVDLLAANAQIPGAQPPAIQPDGTVVIVAPALIEVKAPGEGQAPER